MIAASSAGTRTRSRHRDDRTMPLSVFALGTFGRRGAALAGSHQRAASTACRWIGSRKRSSSRGVLPALWYFHPRFLRTITRARLHPRAGGRGGSRSTLLFVQDGWCVRFEPARPFAKDAGAVPHAWDMRADWRAPDPACSAIMTRSYRGLASFLPGSSTCRRPTTAGRCRPTGRPVQRSPCASTDS